MGLPAGHYNVEILKSKNPNGAPDNFSFCDCTGQEHPSDHAEHCWFAKFAGSGLGIHPDGNKAKNCAYNGTEGCIGIELSDASGWYKAFRDHVGSKIVVDVVEEEATTK